MNKKYLSLILIIILLFNLFPTLTYADNTKSPYYGKFPFVFEYEDKPTFRCDAFYENYPELVPRYKNIYETLTSYLPDEILKTLKDDGLIINVVFNCKWYVDEKLPMDYQLYGMYTGKEIYLTGMQVELMVRSALIHEMIHAYDAHFKWKLSRNSEFKEIYNKEHLNSWLTAEDDSSELFAETAYYYIKYLNNPSDIEIKDYLLNNIPKTTEYVKNKLNLQSLNIIDILKTNIFKNVLKTIYFY